MKKKFKKQKKKMEYLQTKWNMKLKQCKTNKIIYTESQWGRVFIYKCTM